VHTEIEYIILNTGAVLWIFYAYSEHYSYRPLCVMCQPTKLCKPSHLSVRVELYFHVTLAV